MSQRLSAKNEELSRSIGSISRDKRRDSVEDLVHNNLEKLERSGIVQKRSDEHGAESEQDHSFLLTSQDLDVRARELVASAPYTNFRGSARSPLTHSPIEHRYVNDLDHSKGSLSLSKDVLGYQVVVEHYSDGSKYEGEKYLDKRHGRGVFTFKEGYRYEGNWEDGFMSGFGIFWFDDRTRIYEGEWQNNVFNGRGTAYNHELSPRPDFNGTDFRVLKGNWIKFEGLFRNGMKNGLGTLFIANGDVFVGNFVNDVIHGRGSFTNSKGNTLVGFWRQNLLVEKF